MSSVVQESPTTSRHWATEQVMSAKNVLSDGFNHRRYGDIDKPIDHGGAVLEATSCHPGRRARDHLATVAMAAGISTRRVDETLDLVGLSEVGHRRVGKFSLGMRQRLQLATALLGDPEVLILDEPSNGLDPQGIQWLRRLIKHQAASGHAVLVSSHLLAEMEETVDDVIIISEGKLVLQTTLAELTVRGRLEDVFLSLTHGYDAADPSFRGGPS